MYSRQCKFSHKNLRSIQLSWLIWRDCTLNIDMDILVKHASSWHNQRTVFCGTLLDAAKTSSILVMPICTCTASYNYHVHEDVHSKSVLQMFREILGGVPTDPSYKRNSSAGNERSHRSISHDILRTGIYVDDFSTGTKRLRSKNKNMLHFSFLVKLEVVLMK